MILRQISHRLLMSQQKLSAYNVFIMYVLRWTNIGLMTKGQMLIYSGLQWRNMVAMILIITDYGKGSSSDGTQFLAEPMLTWQYQCGEEVAIRRLSNKLLGEFPAQMASNAENVSIWWRHHVMARIWMRRCTHGLWDCLLGMRCSAVQNLHFIAQVNTNN